MQVCVELFAKPLFSMSCLQVNIVTQKYEQGNLIEQSVDNKHITITNYYHCAVDLMFDRELAHGHVTAKREIRTLANLLMS